VKNEIVEFYGEQLVTAKSDEGVEFVAMKPLCENLGLDWSAQRQRLLRDEVLKEGMVIITTPTENTGLGNAQKTVFIPLEMLNGWLFGVDVSRLKDEAVKQKIIVYKRECYKVLHKHWQPESDSLESRVGKLEVSMGVMSESIKMIAQSMKLIAEKFPANATTNVVMQHPNFVTLNPQLSDNKRRKEEFIRCVIDVLGSFSEGISQTALFHRLEFSQTQTTRRWLHEGVGVFWDMYAIPGNGYRYIAKPEVVEANE